MPNEKNQDVIVKKDELSDRDLDQASGGGRLAEDHHASDRAESTGRRPDEGRPQSDSKR